MEQNLSLAAAWGWENPPEEIATMATKAIKAKNHPATSLVTLGLLDEAENARLLSALPAGEQLLDYAAKEQPAKVEPHIERVKAMRAGLPFYSRLQILAMHDAMRQQNVARRCEQLDCALMMIEGERPVAVFTTFQAMTQFKTASRADIGADPIYQAMGGENLLFAVGARDEISAVVAMGATGGGRVDGEANNVWYASASETKAHTGQRECARLLDHAIENNASDIALQPQKDGSYKVRIRKWGSLVSPRTAPEWSAELAAQVIEVLQSKSGANPSNTSYRDPRDGHIAYRSTVGTAFLRLSFLPLNHLGDVKQRPSVSIRLFSNSQAKVDLTKLGLPVEVEQAVDMAVRMTGGLLLIVGPMNSGKSSTCAAAMGRHVEIFGETKKRISVEDPIERFVDDVTQVNVPAIMQNVAGTRIDDNERFNTILKGSKRHDINVYWVGEVRDSESAKFCVSVASSGHFAASTLHAKNAILAFDILSKMVPEDYRFQLAESLNAIISQRLIPGLCGNCKASSAVSEEDEKQWNHYLDMEGIPREQAVLPNVLFRATPHAESGCRECENGYVGYRPVCEVLPFTRVVRDAASALLDGGRDAREARKTMADNRTLTLIKSALRHAEEGTVDLKSILHL